MVVVGAGVAWDVGGRVLSWLLGFIHDNSFTYHISRLLVLIWALTAQPSAMKLVEYLLWVRFISHVLNLIQNVMQHILIPSSLALLVPSFRFPLNSSTIYYHLLFDHQPFRLHRHLILVIAFILAVVAWPHWR